MVTSDGRKKKHNVLAAAGRRGIVKLIHVTADYCYGEIKAHKKPIATACFSPTCETHLFSKTPYVLQSLISSQHFLSQDKSRLPYLVCDYKDDKLNLILLSLELAAIFWGSEFEGVDLIFLICYLEAYLFISLRLFFLSLLCLPTAASYDKKICAWDIGIPDCDYNFQER